MNDPTETTTNRLWDDEDNKPSLVCSDSTDGHINCCFKDKSPAYMHLKANGASVAYAVRELDSMAEEAEKAAQASKTGIEKKNLEKQATAMERREIDVCKCIISDYILKHPGTDTAREITDLTGFHIHFLPNVEKCEDALKHDKFLGTLNDHYMLPRSFWSKVLAESNGFYSRWDPVLRSNIRDDGVVGKSPPCHWSMCRFLIKTYQPISAGNRANEEEGSTTRGSKKDIPDGPSSIKENSYEWNYITICSLWFQNKSSTENQKTYTHVYLCFDVPKDYKTAIVERCRAAGTELLQGCPFTGYGLIMESVVDFYNNSLWNFREPVRMIEKKRERRSQHPRNTLQRTLTDMNPKPGKQVESTDKIDPDKELAALMNPFQDMAELNRHLIHAQETLAAAINTMELMTQDHTDHCPLGIKGACVEHPRSNGFIPTYPLKQMSRSLTCHSSLLSNLKYRADAFERRLNNEISHAFNLIAVEETFTLKQLLRESRKDERELSTLVSLLTMLFLPGTFFSGFFGMNFFSFETNWKVSESLWLFFATTVPVTIAALSVWVILTDRKVTFRGFKDLLLKLYDGLSFKLSNSSLLTRLRSKDPEESAVENSSRNQDAAVPELKVPDADIPKTHKTHSQEVGDSSSSSPSGDVQAQPGATDPRGIHHMA